MKRRVALVVAVLAVMLLGSAAAVFADTTSKNTDPQVGITRDQLVQDVDAGGNVYQHRHALL